MKVRQLIQWLNVYDLDAEVRIKEFDGKLNRIHKITYDFYDREMFLLRNPNIKDYEIQNNKRFVAISTGLCLQQRSICEFRNMDEIPPKE